MSTFKLPDLGEGLAEAEILAWHVKPGDHVLMDQPMVSVETAKAVVEVPAPFTGTVTALHAATGDIVATGAPLIDFDAGTVVGRMPTGEQELIEQPRAEHREARRTRHRAAPATRALCERLGVDLDTVRGSGTDGLVTLDDVIARATLGAPRTPKAVALPADAKRVPLRGARRAMARSMSMSHAEVSGSTVCEDADLHRWTRRGEHMLRLVRALSAGCAAEPALNAWYDSSDDSRILCEHIDLAIAVDTSEGLIVPVLRDIGRRSPEQLRAAIKDGTAAARNRSVPPADLRGFTLMLSNFGTLAGRYAVPLVVPPAVAILGAGKARDDAVVCAGAIVAHRRMPLSLSFDHRCVTGAEACRFLAAVIEDLEKPD